MPGEEGRGGYIQYQPLKLKVEEQPPDFACPGNTSQVTMEAPRNLVPPDWALPKKKPGEEKHPTMRAPRIKSVVCVWGFFFFPPT